MSSVVKRTKRAIKRATLGWRGGLAARSPAWARRAFGPVLTHLDMLFIDHGVLRLVYLNHHALDDRAARSAQPAPHQIKAFAAQGIRTIVNLRGVRDCGSYWLEREACARHGIKLVDCQFRSRAAPSHEELRRARDLFERIEYPMLMHCKSGADRAGFMSVLYKHLRQGVPIERASEQLSWRFGHIRQADTGILDHFFACYLNDNARRPLPFFEWVEKHYDPQAVTSSFAGDGWMNRLLSGILRRE